MSFDAKTDGFIAPRNDSYRQEHMSTKSLHTSRTPSLIENKQSNTLKENGLTYKYSDSKDQQAFIESTFHTVERDKEIEAGLKLRSEFLEPRQPKPAWVPSSSPTTYKSNVPRKGNQLEKKVPHRPAEMEPGSVEGLIIINGRRDGLDGPETNSPPSRSVSANERSLRNVNTFNHFDMTALENTIVNMPDSPPPPYEYAVAGPPHVEDGYALETLEQMRSEQEELDNAARIIEQRRQDNQRKLNELRLSQQHASPTSCPSPSQSHRSIVRKVHSRLNAALYGMAPEDYFRKDHESVLCLVEFKQLVRSALKVPSTQLTDRDLEVYMQVLPSDGRGNFKLADFCTSLRTEVVDLLNERVAVDMVDRSREHIEKIARTVQMKLKAGLYGTNARMFFQRQDGDHSGSLSGPEFKRLLRAVLKVPPAQLTDQDIFTFVSALDDDGSGDINIEELIDFIERGAEAFFNSRKQKNETAGKQAIDPKAASESPRGKSPLRDEEIRSHIQTLYQDQEHQRFSHDQVTAPPRQVRPFDRSFEGAEQRTFQPKKTTSFEEYDVMHHSQDSQHRSTQPRARSFQEVNPEGEPRDRRVSTMSTTSYKSSQKVDQSIARKVHSRVKASLYGTSVKTFFRRQDKSHDGKINTQEFKRMIRAVLKIPAHQLTDAELGDFVQLLDQDGSGDLDLAEMVSFIENGCESLDLLLSARQSQEQMDDDRGVLRHSRNIKVDDRSAKSRSANSKGHAHYSVLGEAHRSNTQEVTVPVPFASMEMDVLLRRHKMDERERKLVMDVEEAKEKENRRAQRAMAAYAGPAHLRLSQSNFIVKQKREEDAAAKELEEIRNNQFKAAKYRPNEFEDWASMEENAQVERAKRAAQRAQELLESVNPPSMVHRETKARASRRMDSLDADRPRSITKPHDNVLRTKDPETVRADLERAQQKWDKQMALKKEALNREKQTVVPQNPFHAREESYERKTKERQERKAQREAALEREAKKSETAKFNRAMKAPVPEAVRLTRASVLKVEAIRSAQHLEYQQQKREKARQEARLKRAKEAAQDLRPHLLPRSRQEEKQQEYDEDGITAKAKARQTRLDMEDRVKASRPSLMERHDMLTAKDKARASTLRRVGGALRSAYGGGDDWLAAAIRDDVLDAEEAEFLRLANPSATELEQVPDDDEY